MPKMHFVDSSNVESIGYDSEAQELHVTFMGSGGAYVYTGVPQEIFDEFLGASSKGSFLNREIKNVYPFIKQ